MTALTMEREQTLRDVFVKIAAKRGIPSKPSHYQFQVYHEDMDTQQTTDRALNYKDEGNLSCLNMNTPVKDLKHRELILLGKYFVDSPVSKKRPEALTTLPASLAYAIQVKKEQALLSFQQNTNDEDIKEEDILLNDISATTYKVIE